MVHTVTGTSTYQYVGHVQHGIRQYESFTVVRTGMYWYIPVRTTFNKTSCFLTPSHPELERVRRDKIKVVQLLCIIWNPDEVS
jgi:hypothetical protein